MTITKYAVVNGPEQTEFATKKEADNYTEKHGGKVQEVEEVIEETTTAVADYEVALWRIKSVLKLMGMEASIQAAIEQMNEPDRTVAATAWEYAYTIARNSATVGFVQKVLQLKDEEVTAIFEQAQLIDV